MTSRAGEPFEPVRALAETGELLAALLPFTGPTTALGDPVTGERAAVQGPGFRIVPLREGASPTGVYAPEAHLFSLAEELDRRFGTRTTIRQHRRLCSVTGL
ncbi:hypothetical protein [Streptomyces sp. NPDC057554]|uniref:hypothetical protein n=1 Tax=Streptomyces sp. NPDC057554 TaxID=3350538 RepID=UPI0036AAF125